MNPKHRRFVAEFLRDHNATQAAIRSGYSKKCAEVQGSRLLSNAKIRAAVNVALKKIEDDSVMSARETLQRLSVLARSDIRGLFNDNGSLKPVSEWSDEAAQAIAGVDIDELFEGVGRDRFQAGLTKKVKLWNKNHALETLARHHKLLTDKLEVTDATDWAAILRERREKLKRKKN